MDPRTVCGDALEVMKGYALEGTSFDGVVTSPVYGNRMSDHHIAQDDSRRHSYTHDLGRQLTTGNIGATYFWQPAYEAFHRDAWTLARRVTRREGLFFLNVKNFYRKRERVNVVGTHVRWLGDAGWKVRRIEHVGTPSMKHGENAHGEHTRFDKEAIIIAQAV